MMKYDLLEAYKIPYDLFEHPPVYTVEEAKIWTHHLKGVHCKNLFLRNRSGKQHYLVVLEEDQSVDLKKLSQVIGTSGLSFASPERLMQYLGVEPGSVGPFGLVNDLERHVKVFIEKRVYRSEFGAFHPNTNRQTLVIKMHDLLVLLENFGYRVEMIDLEVLW